MKVSHTKGIVLVEVVIGIGIVAVVTVAIGLSITTYLNARNALLDDVKAVYLAEEGYELIRALRNDNWTTFESLAIDIEHYLAVGTSSLAFTATPEVIDTNFERLFYLRDVYRDTNDDITASTTSGASVDSGMREVEVHVGGPNGTTTFVGILGNVFAL